MTAKTYLDANTYLREAWRLAEKIFKSGWKPDLLAGLWRGGAFPAAAVHEYLACRGWKMRHAPLKCGSYGAIGSAGEVKFEFAGELFDSVKRGDRVLAVDDVFDTGRTAEAVRAKFSALGADVKIACVHWKPGKNETAGKPDYFEIEDGDGWIVFPHELCGLSPCEIDSKDPGFAIMR